MNDGIRISESGVKESIKSIKASLNNITIRRDELANSMAIYQARFKDEISYKSSELIKKIDDEIAALNEAFDTFMDKNSDIMDDIGVFRGF